MPEYLAPSVYVEEVDTGSKPIEGVSTSTAGMIGVTERGPVDVPILVTSAGEYQRWFGQYLDLDDFGDHCYLPHAVDGFFTNGGKRLYVARILDTDAAAFATTTLFREEPATDAAILLAPAAPGQMVVTTAFTGTAPAVNDWVRIGSGGNCQYRRVAAAAIAATNFVALRQPLRFGHSTGVTINQYSAASPTATVLSTAAPVGASSITCVGAGPIAATDLLAIGTGASEELAQIVGAGSTGSGNATVWTLTLQSPLHTAHASGGLVRSYSSGTPGTTTAATALQPGATVLLVVSNATFMTADDIVVIADSDPTRIEMARIGQLTSVSLGAPAYQDYGANSRFDHVTFTPAASSLSLTAPVSSGAVSLTVTSRTGLAVGDLLGIGGPADPTVEYIVIRDLPNSGVSPDPGRIILEAPLRFAHGGATAASLLILAAQPAPAISNSGIVTLAAAEGAGSLIVSGAWTGTDFIGVSTADGGQFYHRVTLATALTGSQNPVMFDFTSPLARPADAGAPVVTRNPLIEVRALDQGSWGNRLRIAAAAESSPLARTRIRSGTGIVDSTHIRLDSPAGIEPGTILSLADAQGIPFDNPFKVLSMDRQNDYLITLAAALPNAAANGTAVVSLEFRLDVYLLRQPDPALPSRNAQVLNSETFRSLSLDPRHSRYIHHVIGTTWTPSPAFTDDDGTPLRLVDNRSEGGSQYIRVHDDGDSTAQQSIRLGPEFLIDVLPDGRRLPARLPLTDGDDQIGAIGDDTYIGDDAVEPRDRTGLNTLRNVETISIVAVPGRTSAAMQGALVNHCELMRYRFAVLDAQRPPADSLVDVQTQRQQFDTKYAALYHPWLFIPDPYPLNHAAPADFAVPPSGHVIGVYARTDVERGVHKAPANEVVRGITGLARLLNKEQQDILNPYPVNINVIRDFRTNNRGIRLFGGRVITSDSDWKYVNVRRLLIFIEASIDQGLQWVVFEPNAEPLWARVRRSVSNFLTQTWRNGALEGTKPEEAFFVKCDRTTMTQTDIDQGRLICLVGVAPVKPAEFVIMRIGLWTAFDGQ
ncbi:MAG TPA: phage tail sheath C-terminal domain-containing protein [Rhizomicrobium sp.]